MPESPHPAVQRFSVATEPKSVAPKRATTAVIRRLAEKQHGVVAARQLIALGLTEGLIKSRVKDGQLIAAQLWGIRGSRRPIEVTRVSGHRRPHGVRLHQTRSLPDEHVTREAGIPVTTLERTLLDTASRLDERQLEHDLVTADRSRRLRWSRLWKVLTEHDRGRKGAKRLKRVAARVDPRFADAVSTSEVDFLILCREEGLKMPQVNVLVEGKRVDFYWPKERLIVEADSYGYHADRPSFELDHQSTVDLEVAGYRVHRTTYKMLESNPRPFLGLVRTSLAP